MYTFIVVLILVVSILLAVVVLVQNSKGGGLAANFSAPNQVLGVRRTTDFIEKATWTLSIVLVVLCIIATAAIPHRGSDEPLKNNVTTTATTSPVTPIAQPEQMPIAE